MSGERLSACAILVAEARSKEKKEELPTVPIILEEVFKHAEPKAFKGNQTVHHMNGSRPHLIEDLAALVRMALPLAECAVSDVYTDDDRERLRNMTQGDGIFRLSNALNGLCGSRARMHVMNKQGES